MKRVNSKGRANCANFQTFCTYSTVNQSQFHRKLSYYRIRYCTQQLETACASKFELQKLPFRRTPKLWTLQTDHQPPNAWLVHKKRFMVEIYHLQVTLIDLTSGAHSVCVNQKEEYCIKRFY